MHFQKLTRAVSYKDGGSMEVTFESSTGTEICLRMNLKMMSGTFEDADIAGGYGSLLLSERENGKYEETQVGRAVQELMKTRPVLLLRQHLVVRRSALEAEIVEALEEFMGEQVKHLRRDDPSILRRLARCIHVRSQDGAISF